MIPPHWFVYGLGSVGVALVFLTVAKAVFDHVTPYSVMVQLTQRDNPALGAVLIGYLFGVAALMCSVFASRQQPIALSLDLFIHDVRHHATYLVIGLLMLLLSGWLNDRFLLYHVANNREIVEKRNTCVGAIMGLSFAGSGMVIAGAIHGGGPLRMVITAYILGQAALLGYGFLCQYLASYDDLEELVDNQNLAAGIALGGNVAAYGLVLMRGTALAGGLGGTLTQRLVGLGHYAFLGALLLPLLMLASDRLFLPRQRLSQQIAEDRNTNAGFLAAALALVAASLLFWRL